MRSNTKVAVTGLNNVSQTGAAIDANQLVSASFQLVPGDTTAVITMKVQASNDMPNQTFRGLFVPTNWVDIPSATVTNTANTNALVLIPVMSFNYIRVVTSSGTPGSGTLTVNMCAIGV